MADVRWQVRESDGGVTFPLHVQPRAKRTAAAGLLGSALRLKVTAPAVEGAANRAVIDYFAVLLNVHRSQIRILTGEKARDKVLRIDGVSLKSLLAVLPY